MVTKIGPVIQVFQTIHLGQTSWPSFANTAHHHGTERLTVASIVAMDNSCCVVGVDLLADSPWNNQPPASLWHPRNDLIHACWLSQGHNLGSAEMLLLLLQQPWTKDLHGNESTAHCFLVGVSCLAWHRIAPRNGIGFNQLERLAAALTARAMLEELLEVAVFSKEMLLGNILAAMQHVLYSQQVSSWQRTSNDSTRTSATDPKATWRRLERHLLPVLTTAPLATRFGTGEFQELGACRPRQKLTGACIATFSVKSAPHLPRPHFYRVLGQCSGGALAIEREAYVLLMCLSNDVAIWIPNYSSFRPDAQV